MFFQRASSSHHTRGAQTKRLIIRALAEKNLELLLAFWTGISEEGKMTPEGRLIHQALSELGEARMTGGQQFASDQRLARFVTFAKEAREDLADPRLP